MAAPPPYLRLPFFIASVAFLFWSSAIGFLFHRIPWASSGLRNDIYDWASFFCTVFGVKIVQHGKQGLAKDRRYVYLSNHRSWADFFVDLYLTEGRAAPMSRTMVALAFPVFMACIVVLKGIILFKRGAIADKDGFNKWLDEKLAGTFVNSMLVYPEGHRSTKPTSLPLKRGMLYYAHSRGLPVQIIMSNGKENAMSEKAQRSGFGAMVVTGFSRVVESKGRPFEEFSAELFQLWGEMWDQVYSADYKSCPAYLQTDVPRFDYSKQMRQQTVAVAGVSILLLLLTMFFSWRTLLALTSFLPGFLQVAVLLAGAGLLVASAAACKVDNDKDLIKASKKAS